MAQSPSLPRPAVILVPGYWLGAWVWQAVADRLSDLSFDVDAVTLPGLESRQSDRTSIQFADHVGYVADRVRDAGRAVLIAHSGAGAVVTAVADRMPDALTRVVYVDSGPVADGHVPRPDLPDDQIDLPFPGLDELAEQGASSQGLSEADRARFHDLAVPHPAGACREPVRLDHPRRNEIPTTLVCCSIPSATVREMAAAGEGMFAPVSELSYVTLLDLPTGHWPMLSRPAELADILAAEAAV